MKSLATADFWRSYAKLSSDAKKQAQKSYQLWQQNLFHPSLHFKKVGKNLWSARISCGDQLYLVTLPEFSTIAMQPCTHGTTYQEAVQNAQEAIEGYILYCQDEQIPIPEADRLQVA